MLWIAPRVFIVIFIGCIIDLGGLGINHLGKISIDNISLERESTPDTSALSVPIGWRFRTLSDEAILGCQV
jgi:hypothetical protein